MFATGTKPLSAPIAFAAPPDRCSSLRQASNTTNCVALAACLLEHIDNLVLLEGLVPEAVVPGARHVDRDQVVDLRFRVGGAVARIVEEAERARPRSPQLPDIALERYIHGAVIGVAQDRDFEAEFLSAASISATSRCGFLSGPTSGA